MLVSLPYDVEHGRICHIESMTHSQLVTMDVPLRLPFQSSSTVLELQMCTRIIFTERRYASAVYVVACVCLSVSPSVCHKPRSSIQTVNCVITQSKSQGMHVVWYFNGVTYNRDAKYTWCRKTFRLSTNNSLKRYIKQTHSFYERWIGSHMRSIEWWHCDNLEWPQPTQLEWMKL